MNNKELIEKCHALASEFYEPSIYCDRGCHVFKLGNYLTKAIPIIRAEMFKKIEEVNALRPYPHSGIVIEDIRWQSLKEGEA